MPAVRAKGTQVQVESPEGSGLYVKYLGVQDVEGWGVTPDELDGSDQDSPNDYEEIQPGMKKMSPLTFRINIRPGNAGHLQLKVDPDTNKIRKYRRVEPTGEWEQHDCFVIYTPSNPYRGLRTANISLRPVTEPVRSDA